MSSPKFRDLSAGSKSLVLIEFVCFAGALLLSLYLNKVFQFVVHDTQSIAMNILFIHSVVFALVVQLSCLAMGLYDSKLRENLRGVIRRLLVSIAIGFFIVSLVNPFYGSGSLAIELLAVASLVSFFLVCGVRYFTLQIDFFGLNKRNILVLGAGERASIIEKRMRRDVDRQSFFMHGFVVMNGDAENGIVNENRINLDCSLVNYALEHQIDEIVVANDERRENLPVDELFACKIRGVEITEILDFIERETGQIAVNLIYPSWVIYSNGFASANHLRNTLDWIFNATMGFFLFLVTWPVMLITALLIPEFVQQLIKNIPYYNERHNVKPGLTGWAQLKYPYGATEKDSLEKLKYDLYYIKHRSFMLDLLILIRTVEIVLFGKGR